ncbi:MAG: hypothetical protein MUQ30_01730 [Anaerolineae bacterium]|nr:hypothetical protein [Anaerolineae bacterium]
MIILNDVPFGRRAKFLHDSICGIPEGSEFGAALREAALDVADVDVTSGLKAHQDLLRRLYSDIDCVDGKSDRDKYLNLIATVAFLYAVFASGTLVGADGQYSVRIDKALLTRTYRKGGLTRRKRHLEHHGFSIKYVSGEDECSSLSKASHLIVSCDRHPDLVPALKHFAECTESLEKGTNQPICNKLGIFLRADYEAALLQKPIPRDGLDPLQDSILDTISVYRQPWTDLVDRFRDGCGLTCSGFWTYGGTPSWGVSFSQKGKRPLAIFTLGSDIVFIEFTLPVDAAEAIIRERSSYSNPIREGIESLHCVKCPKACEGSNLVQIDGVSVCTGRAEARRIYTYLSSPEDFISIHSMLGTI